MTKLLCSLTAMCLFAGPCFAEDGDDKPATRSRPRRNGALVGRFVLDGPRPVRKLLEIPALRTSLDGTQVPDADQAHYSQLKLTDDSIIVSEDGGIENILIAITDKSVPIPNLPPVRRLPLPATLTFKDGRLQPHVLGWWAPSRLLQIQNADSSAVQLRWDSASGSTFNQLLAPKKDFMQQLEAEQIPGRVRSDVFPWLQAAVIYPSPHPYVAVTRAGGRFAMPGLPAGEWEFRAWHERSGWIKTEAWPDGRFRLKIESGQLDLGTVKLGPAVFDLPPAPAPVTAPASATVKRRPLRSVLPPANRPTWKQVADERLAKHDRIKASDSVGTWRLSLPAGFHYDVTLRQDDDGLLVLDADFKGTLLGRFAFVNNQLQLVKPNDDGIDDFIWQQNDEGNFVLITDRNRVGASYIGAVLLRTR